MRKHSLHKIFYVCLLLVSVTGYAQETLETWMPDAALRAAVREALEVPADVPLTREKMQGLVVLVAKDRGISDLTGLEFATNLRKLYIGKNPITDLGPLANLTQLAELHFWHVPQRPTDPDLRPLANLINLKVISLEGNGISDISSLAGLKKLQRLYLSRNHIEDIRPLIGLTELSILVLEGNPVRDLSPLDRLNLTELYYDETCEIPPPGPSALERIRNKHYPAIFQPFSHFDETPEEYDIVWSSGDPELYHKRVARNDLYFSSFLTLYWASDTQPYPGLATRVGGNLELAHEWRETQLALNPNLVFLFQVPAGEAPSVSEFPPDSDIWLRDADGGFAGGGDYTFNILRPEVQQLLIDKFVGIAECGLFDGIMLDGFFLNGTVGWDKLYEELSIFAGREITSEDIIQIYRHILGGVRERVRPDFLIIVNANVTRPDRYTEFVNGSFMEADAHFLATREGLRQMEEVLSWNEENLRTPQINCLEGRALDGPSHSPENLRRMRLVTTLSLTHSNGYVDYTTHLYESATGPRLAPWYDFWDVDLGQPIGEKGQRYENREGLFIREFTNGWAVYNRSGKERKIQLPEKSTGVHSGVKNRRWHTIPDLDGEIYLKSESTVETPPTADVSGGDTVNPFDVNKDGNVDIADVKLVALAFSQTGDAIEDPSTDVDGNNTVDITDLLLVIDNVEADANAPSDVDMFRWLSQETFEALNSMALRSVLATVHLRNDGSLKYERAIAFLESLLASVHPDETRLLANYPNPFNPETWIPYHLANAGDVRITIYDTHGTVVRQLDLGHQREGYYTNRSRAAYWDGRNAVGERVASGTYFYQLQAEGLSYLRKMVVVK